MINLRYHIVSITAVFLALGIGTALGGTFLDRYTVDVLDRNIRSAEARIRDTDAENARLDDLLSAADEREEALIENGSAPLYAGLLDATPVLIVTSEGVDSDIVADLRQALARADADVRGTLELRNDLALRDDADEALAEAVDADPSDPDAVRNAVHQQLRDAFVAAGQPMDDEDEGANGPGETDGSTDQTATTEPDATGPTATVPEGQVTTTVAADPTGNPTTDPTTATTTEPIEEPDDGTPDGDQPEIVTTLLDLDLLRLTPGPGFDDDDPVLEQTGYRYVFVGGPDLDATASRLMLSFLPTSSRESVPAVVVSATVPTPDDDDATPTIVAQLRASNDRAALYSTVDQVDTFAGLTATVLVLRDLDTAEVGHYGQADGASAVLPGAP